MPTNTPQKPNNAPAPTPKQASRPDRATLPAEQAGKPNTVTKTNESAKPMTNDSDAAAIQRPPSDS